jgi:integrase
MTTVLEGLATPAAEPEDQATAELWAAISPDFLDLLGWSAERRVIAFPQTHPQLGWRLCAVPNCNEKVHSACGLCTTCLLRWNKSGQPQIDEFRCIERIRVRETIPGCCSVSGCELPWKAATTALCNTHDRMMRRRKVTTAEFIADPSVVGYPAFGRCAVLACLRERDKRSSPYCSAHAARWWQHRQETDPAEHDEPRFRRTQPAVAVGADISLRGLPNRVAAEMLYGLQQKVAAGSKTDDSFFRSLGNNVRVQEVQSLTDATMQHFPLEVRQLGQHFVTAVRRLGSSPEAERHKDVWDTTVFGFSGTLKFEGISQPWLREAAKVLTYNDLPRRRGQGGKAHCQTRINDMALLSDSLRIQRSDKGNHVSALSRSDITAFLNRIAFLHAQGETTAKRRVRLVRELRRVFGQVRALGLTRAGQPLHGLPDDFTLMESDIPEEVEDSAVGRDLPVEVVRHLCQHLDQLETQSFTEIRVAVELLIDTGRRPDEICQLTLDCLERDQQGKPVLIYDNIKANRNQRRLPIPAATAAVIERQQRRVRARFPGQPVDALKLLPTAIKNPHGRKGLYDGTLQARHRQWVDALPDVNVPMTVQIAGKAETKLVPFDKARMFPYAYRHTYAQRHADAGVAVDVLRDLMDHVHMVTTQGYYRVGEQRRRDAVDRVTTMQFDRHGSRIWREAKTLLDSEHLRRAVGEVATPYGSCSEPSNVAAGGNECPVRFRCVGCAHFSTDVSYLPDLEAYLADLMRSRERLLSVVDADEWAKVEAMPSDEEIRRIRRLISRIKADVDDLSAEDRAKIEDSVGVVRRARNQVVGLGLPKARQPLPDIRPDRSA